MIAPDFPQVDPERAERIIQDVISLMKISASDDHSKVSRWLTLTLLKAQRFTMHPWWFAKRLFGCRIFKGQDLFDLTGDMDRIIGVYAGQKLTSQPLGTLLEKRLAHYQGNQANQGDPVTYAHHRGRLHLWPAPKDDTLLIIDYCAPLDASMVPPEWEPILIDGIIGLYGIHYNSSGLVGKPEVFAPRFYEGLKTSRKEHFDTSPTDRRIAMIQEASAMGLNLFDAWAESAQGAVGPLSVKPSLRQVPGEIQILADEDRITCNKPRVPIAQIPGNFDPKPNPEPDPKHTSDPDSGNTL